MTLKDFSKITGYSISTLSKVFSGSKEVSDDTAKSIIAKAKELGCYHKYNKSKYQKKIIAVIVPETSSAYYTGILASLKKLLENRNATMVISLTDFSLKEETDLIGFYSSQGRADGIIIIEGKSQAKKHTPVPIIYMNAFKENIYADTVNTDFYSGILEAVNEFRENSHKKIAFIGEKLTDDKLQLFYKAMEFRNMKVEPDMVVVENQRFEEAGFNGMEKLFKSGNIPTAVFAAYDYIALGVIHSMEKHGLKCPDDISVIGVDNIKIASYHNISLSSINTNVKEITELITEVLFKKIENKNYTLVQNISVKSNLILRNSIKNLN